ncbi:MAG: glycosyltransferase involved in cell wall biosynthesis [Marinoscillum sp.]|jgi:glycosyltransferase involved in cell wall biosynthesis
MNILIITAQGDIAGSTYSVKYLALELSSMGHTIHVACPSQSILFQELGKFENIVLHPIPFSAYYDISSSRLLTKVCAEHSIQIICCQSGIDRTLAIAAKILWSCLANLVFVRRQRPRDEPWLKRYFHVKYTSKIVLVSNGLKALFLDKVYPETHLHVIHNGLPPEDLDKESLKPEHIEHLKLRLGIGSELVLGCVSRLKHQEVIIKSLKYLDERLTILFVGIDEADLQEVILQECPKQKIIFTGLIPRTEVGKYYCLMDVFVLASKMDGFGLVLLEAMKNKVPVVASNFGGIPDVIQNGKNGFLFDNDKPEELAENIKIIISNNELRVRLISQGLITATEKFSIEQTAKNFQSLFESILEERTTT